MNRDGMSTDKIKTNPGEQELTLSMSEAFDKLEEEGKLPEPPEAEKVEPPADKPEVPEEPEKEVTEPEAEKPEAKEEEPPKVEEPPEEPEEDPNYDLDELNKLAQEEEEKEEEKPEEYSRADDDDAKAEIEEIQNNPHTPEKTKKSIKRLLGNINRLKKVIGEREGKLQTLESKVAELENAPPQDNSISEQERHELNMLRMKHNIGNDENIRKNFDEPISATEKKIYDIVDRSLPDDQAKQVRDLGFENFARRFPSAYRELLENLNDNSPLDASILSSSVNDLLTLKSSRAAEVDKMTASADDYFSNQEKAVSQAVEERQKKLEALKRQTYQDLIATNPLYAEIPTKDLAGEDLKIANQENRLRAIYREKAKEFVEVNTVEGQQRLISYATLSFRLADRVKQLSAELKRLQAGKQQLVEKRSLRKPKENPEPKEEETPPPASFGEALDRVVNRNPNPLRSTRSIPR